MATSWKAQIGGGEYCLQFETDDKELYRIVEKAAQKAMDLHCKKNKKNKKKKHN